MYSKMLVPLDGSPLSECVLPYARSFARAFGFSVELMHVVPPEAIEALTDARRGRGDDVVRADLVKTSEAYLDRVARSFPDASRVQRAVEVGQPADRIIDRAHAAPDALLAMTTRGHSGLKRWLLGSVASKVLHGVAQPLFLVKASKEAQREGEARLRRILVPLDGSDLAEKALPHAALMSKALKLQVELIRAYAAPTSAMVPANYLAAPEEFPGMAVREALRERAEAYLENQSSQLVQAGIQEVSHVALEGEAAERIIDAAQGTRDNLVAMCTHGRSGVGRWVLGSVTERVLSHSGDPVLVIRPSTDKR